MPDQSNVIKVALILLIVLVLIFGGLGIMYMTKLGDKTKPDTVEAQLHEKFMGEGGLRDYVGDEHPMVKGLAERLGYRLTGDVKGEIPELKEKIRSRENKARLEKEEEAKIAWEFAGKELEIAHTKWEKEKVVDETQRQRRSRQYMKTLTTVRTAHHEFATRARQRIQGQIESGDPNDPEAGANLRSLRNEKDKLEQGYTDRRQKLQNDSDDITKELTKEKLRYESRYKEKRDRRSGFETEYVQIREELQTYMVREPPAIDVSHCGIALTVDIGSRIVVLNIGTRHGVKLGMRFAVFQIRGGSRRIHKGFLYVRSAGRETANCIVMDKAIMLPRCPSDGYMARYPEELFCPYCSGSGGELRVQKLSAIPKSATMGMNPDDPIVVGDYVHNPFFEPGKRLHFAVKGDPENPVSDLYQTEEFIKAVRWHGGLIDAEVSAQTDVLLAGKYAVEDVRRARELGVKILRQYEVFDYLRK